MRSFVQRDCLPDDVGATAQPVLPELMADDDDLALIRILFFRCKSSPQLQCHAEGNKKVTGHEYSGDLNCAIVCQECDRMIVMRSQTCKALRLSSPGQEIGIRHKGFRDALAPVVLPDWDEAAGLLVWKRTKDDRIDHAEEGHIHADAQCQREHGNQREAGFFHQHSCAVTHVLPECDHKSSIFTIHISDERQELPGESRRRRFRRPYTAILLDYLHYITRWVAIDVDWINFWNLFLMNQTVRVSDRARLCVMLIIEKAKQMP